MAEPRLHPDIFTPEEAVEYLHLESLRTLDWLAEHCHLLSQNIGNVKRYHREDLDDCVRRAFGKSPAKIGSARTTGRK